MARAGADSLGMAAASQGMASVPAPGTAGGGGEAPGSIEERLKDNIRTGIYGMIAFVLVTATLLADVVIAVRRRLKKRTDLTFSDEIRRMIDEREEAGELEEESEDFAENEFRTIRREMNAVIPPVEAAGETPLTPAPLTAVEPEPSEQPPAAYEPAWSAGPQYESRSDTITEEVKGLVTRMYREGRSIPDIARAADLTQTEVELIVAVRARRMEHLIQEAAVEEESPIDADHLYQAIAELKFDGESNRGIAHKLGISTSEVQLALSLMERRKAAKAKGQGIRGK